MNSVYTPNFRFVSSHEYTPVLLRFLGVYASHGEKRRITLFLHCDRYLSLISFSLPPFLHLLLPTHLTCGVAGDL
jgi:hypothetical protein